MKGRTAQYVQDLIALTPRWNLIAGVRHSRFDYVQIFNSARDADGDAFDPERSEKIEAGVYGTSDRRLTNGSDVRLPGYGLVDLGVQYTRDD